MVFAFYFIISHYFEEKLRFSGLSNNMRFALFKSLSWVFNLVCMIKGTRFIRGRNLVPSEI